MKLGKPASSALGIGVLAACAAGALLAAPAASAAQTTQTLTCDGQQVVIRTNDNNSSDMGGWSAAQIVSGGSGTLIPTSFSFAAYDVTTEQQLFSFTAPKGGGEANHNQQTMTCVQTETATLADLLEPGDEVPPGASLTDVVTATFTATAVHQP
jgi:hypothetical protein